MMCAVDRETCQLRQGGLATLWSLDFTLFTGPSPLSTILFLPLPSPSFLFASSPLPLEVGPLNRNMGGLGNRCKLPQQGLGWSPSGN